METGDWVVGNDHDTVTFEEVLELYVKFFFNRILYIVCDCCYSGTWVTKLAKKLDELGIGACGHEAKKNHFFLKVVASCKEKEKAGDGFFRAEGVCAAEDHSMQFPHNKFLRGSQKTMVLDTTSMRCFRDPSTECSLHKMERKHQWKWVDLLKKHESLSKRFEFVCSTNYWYAVFFHESKCDKMVEISENKLSSCGFIVAKGKEPIPPREAVSKLCLYSPLNYDPHSLPENRFDPSKYYYVYYS